MPYRAGGRWLWGPTLGRRLYKAFWQLDATGHPVAWLNGVARQLSLFRHVPLLSEMAQKILELLSGHKERKVEAEEYKPWTMRTEVAPEWDEETLYVLNVRYGITRDMVDRDLSLIAKVERLPCVLWLECFRMAILMDDA
jgi:hypothetical protein